MIYLIKCGNYLKIGYANDLNKRLSAYKTHSPEIEVIATRNGNKDVETFLHKLFKNKIDHGEWMKYEEDIIEKFNTINISKSTNKYNQDSSKNPCLLFIEDNTEYFKLTGAESNVLSVCILVSDYYKGERELEYPGNIVRIDSIFRKNIEDRTTLRMSTVYNILSALVKKKMLLKDTTLRGIYYLNPQYFFKGTISDRTRIIENNIKYLPPAEYEKLKKEIEESNNPNYQIIEGLK